MTEPLYLLMVLVDDNPDVSYWAAVKLEGIGRVLTRDQAEAIATRQGPGHRRFLLRHSPGQTDRFAQDEKPSTMAILGGETIWQYGEPLWIDLLSVLYDVIARPEKEGQAYVSPWPDLFPVPVEPTVTRAIERFGEAERHDVEHVFDELMLQAGGKRHDDPPCYHVPLSNLGLG